MKSPVRSFSLILMIIFSFIPGIKNMDMEIWKEVNVSSAGPAKDIQSYSMGRYRWTGQHNGFPIFQKVNAVVTRGPVKHTRYLYVDDDDNWAISSDVNTAAVNLYSVDPAMQCRNQDGGEIICDFGSTWKYYTSDGFKIDESIQLSHYVISNEIPTATEAQISSNGGFITSDATGSNEDTQDIGSTNTTSSNDENQDFSYDASYEAQYKNTYYDEENYEDTNPYNASSLNEKIEDTNSSDITFIEENEDSSSSEAQISSNDGFITSDATRLDEDTQDIGSTTTTSSNDEIQDFSYDAQYKNTYYDEENYEDTNPYNTSSFTEKSEDFISPNVPSSTEEKLPISVNVRLSGAIANIYSVRIGIYKLQPIESNNFPVWKHETGDYYLRVESNTGYWSIGTDISGAAYDATQMYIPKNTPTPLLPFDYTCWAYKKKATWITECDNVHITYEDQGKLMGSIENSSLTNNATEAIEDSMESNFNYKSTIDGDISTGSIDNSTGALEDSTGSIDIAKDIVETCFEYGKHYEGGPLHKPGTNDNIYTGAISAKDCQKLCQDKSKEGCEWFNWIEVTKHCWLKKEKGQEKSLYELKYKYRNERIEIFITGPKKCKPATDLGYRDDTEPEHTTAPEYITAPEHFIGLLGGDVLFNCHANFSDEEPVPYMVQWEKKGSDIPIFTWSDDFPTHCSTEFFDNASNKCRVDRVDSNYWDEYGGNFGAASLSLTNIQEKDQGWYNCKVVQLNRPSDQEKNNGTWYHLSVHAPPHFLVTPEDLVYVSIGDSIILSCQAQGTPDPEILWYKFDRPVKVSKTVSIINDSTELRINNITSKDQGDYSCLARNGEGTISHTAKVVIVGEAIITKPPLNQTRTEGDVVRMACEGEGTPGNLSIAWYRGDKRIESVDGLTERAETTKEGMLVISPVSADDAGLFACELTNGIGRPQRATAYLNVEYPARVVFTKTKQYLTLNHPGIIHCNIESNPTFQFSTWTKDKRIFDPFDAPGIHFLTNGSLKIEKVTKDHAGKYTCTPYNAVGTAGTSEIMKVQVMCSFRSLPLRVAKQMTTRLVTGELLSCGGEYGGWTQENWTKTADCWTTNAGFNTWHFHTSLPYPLSRATLTSLSTGTVFLAGGETGTEYSAATWILSGDGWIPGPDLKHKKRVTGRAGHCAMEWGEGNVMVIGGFNGNYLRTVEEMNPANNESSRLIGLRNARAYHGCTVLNHNNEQVAIVAGGLGKTSKVLASVEMFAIVRDGEGECYGDCFGDWKEVSPLPAARYGLVAFTFGTSLILFGGDEKYKDPETKDILWTTQLTLKSTDIEYVYTGMDQLWEEIDISVNSNVTSVVPHCH